MGGEIYIEQSGTFSQWYFMLQPNIQALDHNIMGKKLEYFRSVEHCEYFTVDYIKLLKCRWFCMLKRDPVFSDPQFLSPVQISHLVNKIATSVSTRPVYMQCHHDYAVLFTRECCFYFFLFFSFFLFEKTMF